MTYIGTVSKGKVVLPPDAKLPEGAKVRVEIMEQYTQANPLTNLFREVSQDMPDLPKDLAAQHDLYLYGKPKR
jgi:hypothetical protein